MSFFALAFFFFFFFYSSSVFLDLAYCPLNKIKKGFDDSFFFFFFFVFFVQKKEKKNTAAGRILFSGSVELEIIKKKCIYFSFPSMLLFFFLVSRNRLKPIEISREGYFTHQNSNLQSE